MAKLGREATKRRGRAPKEATIGEVVKVMSSASGSGFLLLENHGMSLAQATAVRKTMRENKIHFRVVKNTLLRLALQRMEIEPEPLDHLLVGPTIVAVGLEDPVTPAKVLVEHCKDNEKLVIKGGYLDGNVMDPAGVEQLSKLPGREELLTRLLSSLQSPIQNLVYALNDGVSKPVYVLDALRRKLEEEGGNAA